MKKIAVPALILSIIFSFNQTAFAVGSAGFENASFSAKSLSQGNAVVAQADEPAAISYNPAGVVDLPGVQIQNSLHLISILTSHNGPNSHTRSAGTIVPVPTTYLTINPGHYLNDRLAFGIGVDSPFGLSNKYDSVNTAVHYTGYSNFLKMYAIKPVASVKFNDWLSMGAGPIYYRIFDFGGVEAYPNKLFPGGLTADWQIRANLSGNTWGWQYGLLLKPHKKHHLGFYFRSPVTVLTRGLIKVENSTSGNFETGGHAKVNLPLNMTFGYAYYPTPKAVIEADFGYTRWSTHERLYINNDPINTRENTIMAALGRTDKDYRDSFSFHLGGRYDATSKLQLRAGALFYTAAVPENHFIPAVPDSNKIGLAIGDSYSLTKNLKCDLSYVNIFGLKRKISSDIGESLGTSVDGNYFTYLQELTLTFTYAFDRMTFTRPMEKILGMFDNDKK